MKLNVLVACEESQAVTIAFRQLGHQAFSVDLQDCSGGHPEWHIMGDCLPLLPGRCYFRTRDGLLHRIKGQWDIVIGHPPCTYFSTAGSYLMFHPPGILNKERFSLAMAARRFFFQILNCDCQHVAVENPTPLHIIQLPKPSCVIQPYEFGDPYCKRTLLWLRNLPPLFPTAHMLNHRCWVQARGGGVPANTAKKRAKTFPGIANAMAAQWSAFVLEEAAANKRKSGGEAANLLLPTLGDVENQKP